MPHRKEATDFRLTPPRQESAGIHLKRIWVNQYNLLKVKIEIDSTILAEFSRLKNGKIVLTDACGVVEESGMTPAVFKNMKGFYADALAMAIAVMEKYDREHTN